MAFTKVSPAGIGSTPGDGYRIGDSFLHSTGVEITNINATGILTAASLDISGAIDFDGHTELDNVNISGVSTFAGNIDANGDLDVDGHTNLDNVSVSGVSTFSGIVAAGVGSTAITLGNSHKMTFGSEHELEMFHDGSNSYIKQRFFAYPSRLKIISENNGIDIMSGSGGNMHGGYENAISCEINGATKIYHAGVGPYFETYGAGVMFQGNIQVGQDIFHHTDTDTKISFPAHNTISFTTTGDERLRIEPSGRLLIANISSRAIANVTAKIQLEGTSGDGSAVSITRNSANANPPYLNFGKSRATSTGGNTIIQNGDNLGEIRFSGADGNDLTNHAASINAEVDGSPSNNVTPGRLIFSTATGSDPIERLRITSDGDVGIGHDAPDASYGTNLNVHSTGGNTGARIKLSDGTSGTGNVDGFDLLGINGRAYVINRENHEMYFSTNNLVRMRINGGGQVNIGNNITQTSKQFYVDGTAEFTSNITCMNQVYINGTAPEIVFTDTNQDSDYTIKNDGGELRFIDRTNSNTTMFYVNSGGFGGNRLYVANNIVHTGDTDTQIEFGTDIINFDTGGSERLRITSNGNIGVGNFSSINPARKVHLHEASANTAIYATFTNGSTGTAASNGFTLGIDSSQAAILNNYSSTDIKILCNGGERFRITSGGDVSIGNVTPARGPLHVHENSSGDCQIHLTNNDTGSSSTDGLTIYTDTDTSGIWSRENVDFQIATNSTERVRIHADGRMNIGGTNECQLTANNQAILYLHGAVVGADLDGMFGLRTVMDDDDTGTTTADRERGSAYFQFNGNCSGGDTTDETRLWNIWSDVNATTDYDNCYGLYADVRSTHTSGTMSTMRGVYGITQTASSGTITEMVGMYGIAQPTTGSSGTVADLVGGKFRANMAAGTSTVKATDLFGVWSQIDNDNDVSQAASGTRTALFYGSYDKTTGLTNPQGIRIDTDVPNYFRGGIAIDGGGSFTPTDDHKIHIKDGTNATGIFLEQTGHQYSVIKADANRTNADNAILDLQGWWNGKHVARIRFDTGVDTSNKDDGELQFATSSANNITNRMVIQPNGEIAMRSSGEPTDALANLHVQNESFRVSNDSDGANTTYINFHTWPNGTDGDRQVYKQVTNGVIKAAIDHSGRIISHSHHYAGRTRTDAASPTNVYAHTNSGFFAYSARTDDSTNYRTLAHMRAWDSGDSADRNCFYFVDSQSDTTTADYDQHQRFGVKADGMTHSREDIWAGRIESDEGTPNSVYTANNTNLVRCYATNSNAQSYMQGVATPATNIYTFYSEYGTSNSDDNVVFRVRSTDGRLQSDAGSVQTGGADYAEFFEWEDGNPSNEDRVGISVVLVGEKIRPATSSDDTSKIIGIISATPSVVGDTAALSYHDRYLKDDWGRYVMEDVEMLVWNHGKNEYQPKQSDSFALTKCDECIPVSDIDKALAESRVKQWAVDQNLRRIDQVLKVNPNYDVKKKDAYEPREDRKEWDAVGLVGKLYMKKGQPTGTNWIKLSDKTASIERWLVR